MPDVSVIIPTFNRLWSLPKAVESCRGGHCSTEIIVVDDGSNDGTWEWLQTRQDVQALRQDNWGKDWAVNKGFALATGEYVRFLDSDDWLVPGSNERQIALARANDSDVVVAGHQLKDEVTGVTHPMPWVHCDDFIAQQLGECSSSHYSAYIFRRTFLSDVPHRQEFGVRDDRMFVIEMALKNPRVSVCDAPTLVHRHHDNARLQRADGVESIAMNLSHKKIYEKAVGLMAARGQLPERRKRAVSNALWPLAHWVAYGNLDEACRIVDWIFELDREFAPPQGGLLGGLYRVMGFRATERLLALRRRLLPRAKL